MIRKVADRLEVQLGTRSVKSSYYNGRYKRDLELRPFDKAISRRAIFDEHKARCSDPFQVGEAVIATSSCAPCKVVRSIMRKKPVH